MVTVLGNFQAQIFRCRILSILTMFITRQEYQYALTCLKHNKVNNCEVLLPLYVACFNSKFLPQARFTSLVSATLILVNLVVKFHSWLNLTIFQILQVNNPTDYKTKQNYNNITVNIKLQTNESYKNTNLNLYHFRNYV